MFLLGGSGVGGFMRKCGWLFANVRAAEKTTKKVG